MKPTILHHHPGSAFFTEERCHITELSNSMEDEALSIALVRVEPGVTTQWHRLQGTCERYLIRAGQGIVELDELPPRTVGPNDVVLIPPDCRQRITNPGDDDLVFHALCTPRFRPAAYEAAEPIGDPAG